MYSASQQTSRSHQSHRPGAEVKLGPKSYLQQQMKRATDIESQLTGLTKKNSSSGGGAGSSSKQEELASKLRMQLCELLSDILLTEPSYALQQDCVGKLWRSCFYTPIGQFRSRISREKRKGANINASTSGGTVTSVQSSAKVTRLEKQLFHFLSEAVTLYDYLVSQYHYKLVQFRSDNSTVNTSKNKSTSESQKNKATTVDATRNEGKTPINNDESIVPGLFRMYIHLGDLHRYSMSYGKAQSCYIKASQLAPGHGNPYNQLAVVAQLKDTAAPLNCVALYWYARSLLTTYDSFEISKANLARLFQSNREWLVQERKKLAKGNNADSSNINKIMIESISNDISEGSNNTAQNRAQKTIASRHFLSTFVDLHYSFFREDEKLNEQELLSLLETRVSDVIELLSCLLKASAFGDSLLCKMVAVHAFSECYHKHVQSKRNKNANFLEDNNTKITKQRVARLAMLLFGTCLAQRVGLEKKNSHRLLLPLLLLCEYVESYPAFVTLHDNQNDQNDQNDMDNLTKDQFATLEQTVFDNFGKNLVLVMNHLISLRQQQSKDAWKVLEGRSLKEYQSLLGFSPFMFVSKENAVVVQQNGFITAAHAADVLELNVSAPMTPTQDSSSTSNTQGAASINTSGGSTTAEENKIKVSRFLALGERLANDTDTELGRRINCMGGLFTWENVSGSSMQELNNIVSDGASKTMVAVDQITEEKQNTPNNDKLSTPVSAKPALMVPEDDGGDVLIYSAPDAGSPSLLVPGDLIQSKNEYPERKNATALFSTAAPQKSDKESNLLAGIGATSAPTKNMDVNISNAIPPAASPMASRNTSSNILGFDQGQVGEKKPSLVPTSPAVMSPPPGFGPPLAATGAASPMGTNMPRSNNLQMQQLNNPSMVLGAQVGNLPMMPPGFGQIPSQPMQYQPSQAPIPPSLSAAQAPPPPGVGLDHNVLGDLQLFGGPPALQTANPFVSSLRGMSQAANTPGNVGPDGGQTSDLAGVSGGGHQQYVGFQGYPSIAKAAPSVPPPKTAQAQSFLESSDATAGLAETSFLDSGLLHSLWMDDSTCNKTNNPFATTN